MDAFERLARWIGEELQVDPRALTPGMRVRDVGSDSLEELELGLALKELGAEAPPEEAWFDLTLGELAERILWP